MLVAIMRKYFLTHDVVLTGNVQHIVSVFFKESEQKDMIRVLILYLIIVSLNVEILDLKMWCEDEVLGMAFIC